MRYTKPECSFKFNFECINFFGVMLVGKIKILFCLHSCFTDHSQPLPPRHQTPHRQWWLPGIVGIQRPNRSC